MTDRPSLTDLESATSFADRHIGTSDDEQAKMLSFLGYAAPADLIADALPEPIRTSRPLDLPDAGSEADTLTELRDIATRNQPLTQMIGIGYHDTVTPPVIRRN